MNCYLCGHPLPKREGCARCPSCHKFNLTIPESNSDEETVLLSDARLSEIDRIQTNLVDRVFGGGLARTSTSLIAGSPGAGKTTLFLQLADTITLHFDREALYIANEQDAAEIKTTAKRIQIRNTNKIRIVKAMGGLRRTLDELYAQYKPCVVMIDSLTKMVGEDLPLAVTVLERLKVLTIEHNCPSLIVNQVNKDGDFAGLKKIEHCVDGTFMLEKDDVDGTRFFYSTKNRFGQAPLGVELEMTDEKSEIPGKLILKESPKDNE
jgi:DNA repair protein RadA/Sms